MNPDQETLDFAAWHQRDAAFLYVKAMAYRNLGGERNNWMAENTQSAAAHSARLARVAMGIEEPKAR